LEPLRGEEGMGKRDENIEKRRGEERGKKGREETCGDFLTGCSRQPFNPGYAVYCTIIINTSMILIC